MRRRWLTVWVVALALVLVYGTAQGANLTKTIKAAYRNIAIVIDGKANIPAEEPLLWTPCLCTTSLHSSGLAQVDKQCNNRVVITTAAKADPKRANGRKVTTPAWSRGSFGSKALTTRLTRKAMTSFDKGKKKVTTKGTKKAVVAAAAAAMIIGTAKMATAGRKDGICRPAGYQR